MEQAKYIVKFLLMLISHPETLWEYLTSGEEVEESKPDYMQQHFYLPLLGFMALFIFLCEGFHGAEGDAMFNLQFGMKQMVPCLVAFLVGPYLAQLLIKMLLEIHYKVPNPNKEHTHLFVFYCTSFLIALEMLLAFIPSFRYLSIIVFYIVYLTWTGSTTIIKVDEKHRWVFCVLSALIIWVSSYLVMHIVQRMQGHEI